MSVPQVAVKNVGGLMEGPHWDPVTQTLFYVDIYGDTVYRYNPSTDTNEKVVVGEHVGCVVTTKSGNLVIGGRHRFAFLDWRTGALQTIQEVDNHLPENMMNDGKCDPAGRFWAGSIGPDDPVTIRRMHQGTLYCLHPDKTMTKQLDKVSISNGMAWTLDNSTMYFIDSLTNGVDAFDYNINTGSISNRRRVIDILPEKDGYPDGMCMDEEGMLWVAHYAGSAIHRYNPVTGTKLQTIKFPVQNVTSCCFGGPNLDELYATTSSYLLSEEEKTQQPLAGSIFRITGLSVKGCPVNTYAG